MAASSGQIVVKVHGLEDLKEKLYADRADEPVGRFLDRGAIYLQGQARKNAAVDRGRLRNSIGVESPTARLRRVGPSVSYGEDVEHGTDPHMPPEGELAGWAKRHGMEESHIRYLISIYGTRAQPFMQPAADDAESYIPSLVPVLAAEIESAFQ